MRCPHKPGRGATDCCLCLRGLEGFEGRSTGEGIPTSSWQAHERKGIGAAICQGTEARGWPQGVSRGQQESCKLEQGLGKALLCAQACSPNIVSLETKGPFSLGFDGAISGWQCQVVGAPGGINLLSPPTPRSSGAGCWGGGCFMLCCHGNHSNPHLPKHKERQLLPPYSQEEPGSGWESSLGNPLSDEQPWCA